MRVCYRKVLKSHPCLSLADPLMTYLEGPMSSKLSSSSPEASIVPGSTLKVMHGQITTYVLEVVVIGAYFPIGLFFTKL